MNVVLVFVLLRQQDLVFYSPLQFWNGHQDIHCNVSVFFILVIPENGNSRVNRSIDGARNKFTREDRRIFASVFCIQDRVKNALGSC